MSGRRPNVGGSPANGDRMIDEYMSKLAPPLREVATATRQVIDADLPECHGPVWHGHPVWTSGSNPGTSAVCFLKADPSYVPFGLWHGKAVSDPSGRLQPGAREMASVKLRSTDDVDGQLFRAWLRQAYEADSAPEH